MAMFMLASDYMHSRWVVIGPKCECIKESVLFFLGDSLKLAF